MNGTSISTEENAKGMMNFIISYLNSVLNFGKTVNFLGSPFSENVLCLLQAIASSLTGINTHQKMYFLLGTGRNGKGCLFKLIVNALGEERYYGNFPADYLMCRNQQKDGRSTALVALQHTRLNHMSEHGREGKDDSAMQFLDDVFKTLSGGDTLSVRDNHAKAHERIMIKPCIHKENEHSSRERVVIFKFPNTFLQEDNPKIKINPKIFKPIDESLQDTFQNSKLCHHIFMTLLLMTWKSYKAKGMRFMESDEMKTNKQKYFMQSDIVGTWFSENYEESIDVSHFDSSDYSTSTTNHMYREFKKIHGDDAMSHTSFKKELQRVVGLRDKYNKTTSRGMFRNHNMFYVQGWQEIIENDTIDENQGSPQHVAQNFL